MTLRSYLIAATVLAIFSAGFAWGAVWAFGNSAEHFLGQDTEQ